MKLLRRILLIALLLALAVLVFQNQDVFAMSVELTFLQWYMRMVLGFWLVFAFILGVALFALADAWRGMLLRLKLRQAEQEIARLKAAAAASPAAGSDAPTSRESDTQEPSG